MWTSTLISALAASSSFAAVMTHHDPRGAFNEMVPLAEQRKFAKVGFNAALDFLPFQLTNINLECIADSSLYTPGNYTCGLKFDWFDPNSVKHNNVSSASCNSSWIWTSKTTLGGVDGSLVFSEPCWQDDHTFFAMGLMMFNDPGNFTLQLAHRYSDPDNFTSPLDYPTTFAQPEFFLPAVQDKWRHTINFSPGINATVIAAIG